MQQKHICRAVALKKFYLVSDIATEFNLSPKEVLYEAAKVGALYRVSKINLVNKPLFKQKYSEIRKALKEYGGKYIKVKEAVQIMGIPEQELLQIASDANSLIILGRVFYVNTEEMEKYLKRFTRQINLFDMDELMEKKRG